MFFHSVDMFSTITISIAVCARGAMKLFFFSAGPTSLYWRAAKYWVSHKQQLRWLLVVRLCFTTAMWGQIADEDGNLVHKEVTSRDITNINSHDKEEERQVNRSSIHKATIWPFKTVYYYYYYFSENISLQETLSALVWLFKIHPPTSRPFYVELYLKSCEENRVFFQPCFLLQNSSLCTATVISDLTQSQTFPLKITLFINRFPQHENKLNDYQMSALFLLR